MVVDSGWVFVEALAGAGVLAAGDCWVGLSGDAHVGEAGVGL